MTFTFINRTIIHFIHYCRSQHITEAPVASFTKEVNPRLAKRPLVFIFSFLLMAVCKSPDVTNIYRIEKQENIHTYTLPAKNLEHLESTMITLVSGISIRWIYFGTNQNVCVFNNSLLAPHKIGDQSPATIWTLIQNDRTMWLSVQYLVIWYPSDLSKISFIFINHVYWS